MFNYTYEGHLHIYFLLFLGGLIIILLRQLEVVLILDGNTEFFFFLLLFFFFTRFVTILTRGIFRNNLLLRRFHYLFWLRMNSIATRMSRIWLIFRR